MIKNKMKLLCQNQNKVTLVALAHLILIVYGMFLTAQDMIVEQYPLSLYELIYVIIYYSIHTLLIGSVLMGRKYMMPILYIPWLIVFLAVFTTATCLWIKSLFNGSVFYAFYMPFIANVIVLGFGWSGWLAVSKEFLHVFFQSKTPYWA